MVSGFGIFLSRWMQCKHKALSSAPQHSCKVRHGCTLVIPVLGGRGRRISGGSLASKASLVQWDPVPPFPYRKVEGLGRWLSGGGGKGRLMTSQSWWNGELQMQWETLSYGFLFFKQSWGANPSLALARQVLCHWAKSPTRDVVLKQNKNKQDWGSYPVSTSGLPICTCMHTCGIPSFQHMQTKSDWKENEWVNKHLTVTVGIHTHAYLHIYTYSYTLLFDAR